VGVAVGLGWAGGWGGRDHPTPEVPRGQGQGSLAAVEVLSAAAVAAAVEGFKQYNGMVQRQ
jgi:hypothetical protein